MPFNRLTSSLVFVVMVGVVGLGFLLSELYTVLDDEQPSIDNHAYRTLGSQLVQTLSEAEDLQLVLQQAMAFTGFELSLILRKDMPLPASLMKSLESGEPLMLQAEGVDRNSALSIYLAIPESDQLLIIENLPVEEIRKSDGTRLMLTLLFYAGLLGVVLIWLAPLVKQLSALRKVTRAFGQGDLEQRLEGRGSSYIAAIETGFNQMADKIQDLMADNRLLSRAVSHDLKTPLARLRFGVEMLSQNLADDNRQKYSQRVERDLDEMESLVTTLLDYARMEDSRPSLDFKALDLMCFVPELIAKHELAMDVEFEVDESGPAEIQADTRYLSMLILNLLSNACQYAQTRVVVSVRRQGSVCLLSVEDDGQGIPESEREQVLKPFVRLATECKAATKGHGMGLAIVQRLANWHGAHIELGDSSELGGAKVVVKFSK